jgi:REP element-mobilizing transposase RayT
MTFIHPTIKSRGYLPHWQLNNGLYAITFRLADSLPKLVLDTLAAEKRHLETKALNAIDKARLRWHLDQKFDEALDRGQGACYLRNPRAANVIIDTLKLFDEQRYQLLAWCVMPNHVHVVMQLFKGHELPRVVHSWKSFTGTRINELLGREGERLWQREYYDRCIRDERELEETIIYVATNPEKAGLIDWPYVWAAG